MNNKTTISLSLLALLSMGLGLSGCGEKTDKNQAVDSSATAANQPLEQDFDQDNDPYPDEYLLEGVGGRTNNNGANKSDNKSQNKTPNKTSRAIPAASIKQQLEAAFPNIKIEEVAKGPVPYLYQVKTEGEVFFTTTDGKLMFVGDLIDLKANKTFAIAMAVAL